MFERMEIGILDDNDIEIREGDYVMFETDASYSTEEGYIGETRKTLGLVAYDKDNCRFFIYQFDTDEWQHEDVFESAEIEIVGNLETHIHTCEDDEMGLWYIVKEKTNNGA